MKRAEISAPVAARRERLWSHIRRNSVLGMASPSFLEHMAREGIASKNTAHRDFVALERAGRICRLPRKARAVEALPPARIAYYQIERVDGESRLAPLSAAPSGASSLSDSPAAANAAGAFRADEA